MTSPGFQVSNTLACLLPGPRQSTACVIVCTVYSHIKDTENLREIIITITLRSVYHQTYPVSIISNGPDLISPLKKSPGLRHNP